MPGILAACNGLGLIACTNQITPLFSALDGLKSQGIPAEANSVQLNSELTKKKTDLVRFDRNEVLRRQRVTRHRV